MTATPKSIAAATRLLEQYADLDGRIGLVEADRTAAIALANQVADYAAEPMVKARDEIFAAVAKWFPGASAELLAKNAKSAQLGGCKLGTRKTPDKLGHTLENDLKAVMVLRGSRFAKHTTKVTYSLDRPATLKLLQIGGKTAVSIAALGFKVEPGTDQFFIERVQQGGTIGA